VSADGRVYATWSVASALPISGRNARAAKRCSEKNAKSRISQRPALPKRRRGHRCLPRAAAWCGGQHARAGRQRSRRACADRVATPTPRLLRLLRCWCARCGAQCRCLLWPCARSSQLAARCADARLLAPATQMSSFAAGAPSCYAAPPMLGAARAARMPAVQLRPARVSVLQGRCRHAVPRAAALGERAASRAPALTVRAAALPSKRAAAHVQAANKAK
jgi:hypothetical protein